MLGAAVAIGTGAACQLGPRARWPVMEVVRLVVAAAGAVPGAADVVAQVEAREIALPISPAPSPTSRWRRPSRTTAVLSGWHVARRGSSCGRGPQRVRRGGSRCGTAAIAPAEDWPGPLPGQRLSLAGDLAEPRGGSLLAAVVYADSAPA